MRLARLARNGIKTAQVTVVEEHYVRVVIENVSGLGHAYLYFPTLTWRVWENHPFSVASTILLPRNQLRTITHDADVEKLGHSTDGSESDKSKRDPSQTRVGLTFIVRTKMGVTGLLRKHTTLPVLAESAYGPHDDLSEYSLLICIAGGVGITTCIPYLHAHPGARKLIWGARSRGIVDAMASCLSDVEKEVYTGKRMIAAEVLRKELRDRTTSAVVLVSGPSTMADEVRCVVIELGRQEKGIKLKLIEEAFTW